MYNWLSTIVLASCVVDIHAIEYKPVTQSRGALMHLPSYFGRPRFLLKQNQFQDGLDDFFFFDRKQHMYILIEKKNNRRMRNPPTRDETKQHKKITRHYTKKTTNNLP